MIELLFIKNVKQRFEANDDAVITSQPNIVDTIAKVNPYSAFCRLY